MNLGLDRASTIRRILSSNLSGWTGSAMNMFQNDIGYSYMIFLITNLRLLELYQKGYFFIRIFKKYFIPMLLHALHYYFADVVYIGCLNPQHYEVIKLMLNNRKAVLCEKPLTLNLKQTSEVVELARKNKVFLQEAVWSRCFPVYKELRKQLDAGVIGDIKQVNVGFGFNLSQIDRLT